MTAAARLPARRLPAKSQFDRPSAIGLMWFSIQLFEIGRGAVSGLAGQLGPFARQGFGVCAERGQEFGVGGLGLLQEDRRDQGAAAAGHAHEHGLLGGALLMAGGGHVAGGTSGGRGQGQHPVLVGGRPGAGDGVDRAGGGNILCLDGLDGGGLLQLQRGLQGCVDQAAQGIGWGGKRRGRGQERA